MAIDCQDVHRALRRGEPLAPPQAEHVADCPACQALAEAGHPLVGAPEPPDEPEVLDADLARLEAALDRERGPVAWLRSRPSALRVLLAVIGAGLVPALVLLTWGRVDRGVYPSGRWALDVVLLVAPVVVALVVVLRPLHRSPWPRWVEPVAVLLAMLAVLVGPLLDPAHQAHPASRLGTGDTLWPAALGCLIMGSLMGLPLLVWLTMLRRTGERLVRPARVVAVAAGATGALAIFLHCPMVAPEHLLLGHATVLVPYLVLGRP